MVDGWLLLPHMLGNESVPVCDQGLHTQLLLSCKGQAPDKAFLFHEATAANHFTLYSVESGTRYSQKLQ